MVIILGAILSVVAALFIGIASDSITIKVIAGVYVIFVLFASESIGFVSEVFSAAKSYISGKPSQSGTDPLIGCDATAAGPFEYENNHMIGRVNVNGELWKAQLLDSTAQKRDIGLSQRFRIVGRDGLTLLIEVNDNDT